MSEVEKAWEQRSRKEMLTVIAAIIYAAGQSQGGTRSSGPQPLEPRMSVWDAVKKADDLMQAADRFVKDPAGG